MYSRSSYRRCANTLRTFRFSRGYFKEVSISMDKQIERISDARPSRAWSYRARSSAAAGASAVLAARPNKNWHQADEL